MHIPQLRPLPRGPSQQSWVRPHLADLHSHKGEDKLWQHISVGQFLAASSPQGQAVYRSPWCCAGCDARRGFCGCAAGATARGVPCDAALAVEELAGIHDPVALAPFGRCDVGLPNAALYYAVVSDGTKTSVGFPLLVHARTGAELEKWRYLE